MKKPNIFDKKNDKPLQDEQSRKKFSSRPDIESVEQLDDSQLEKVAGGWCHVIPI